MELARKIADDDELRAIAAAGTGFVFDPFWRKWHRAACVHVGGMTNRQQKWFAPSRAAFDEFQRLRLAQYPAAQPILPCAVCGDQAGPGPPADAERSASGAVARPAAPQLVPISAALRALIGEHGPAVLSSPERIVSLLAGLLPEEPGIGRMLAAAAKERVTEQLRDPAVAGVDAATAVSRVAIAFGCRTHYDRDTCTWLVGEIAAALGLIGDAGSTPAVPVTRSSRITTAGGRAGRPARPDEDDARAMLERLQVRGHASSLQAIYDGLIELGYIPHVPGKTEYLRWTDPARSGPAVIYLKQADLWFVRTEDLATLGDLPAGTTTIGGRDHNVRFPVNPQTTGQILGGAERLKR